MNKIINGKKYDTNTAKALGTWHKPGGDFDYIEETLYRKKTGEYFIHGEGGARTHYAQRTGNNWWSSGERIMPCAYEEARQWAEDHLDADEYEAIFGVVEEDETKVSATFRLAASTLENVKRRAAEKSMSISEYVDFILGAEF